MYTVYSIALRHLLQTYGGKQMKKRRCMPNLHVGNWWKNLKKQIKLGLQHIKRTLMPWENQIKQVEVILFSS